MYEDSMENLDLGRGMRLAYGSFGGLRGAFRVQRATALCGTLPSVPSRLMAGISRPALPAL